MNSCSRAPEAPILNPTVFIVDDDPSSCHSLATLIRSAGWDAVTASCAQEFLDRPWHGAAGCLLIEQHLPGLSGLELQRLVVDRQELPIIIMSRAADIPSAVRAMRAGALEFLAKPMVSEMLLTTISQAFTQSEAALQRLAHRLKLAERFRSLSRREREVMELVAGGLPNRKVADTLGISEITVKVHRGRMMRKMCAPSLAALVNMHERIRQQPSVAPSG